METIQGTVERFADAVLQQFPLTDRLDTGRCLRHVAELPVLKRVEWAWRCRAPLRICVGAAEKPELFGDIFHPDHDTHTVLCLLSDLMQHLREAPARCPLPPTDQVPPGVPQMKVLHICLYRAELDQDRVIGLAQPVE